MRKFKQVCLFIAWLVIFWGGSYKLGILNPHLKPKSLNIAQFIGFALIFWQTYWLVDILVARKMHVSIYKTKKRRIMRRINLPGLNLTIYKIVFISIISEKHKIWLSKISTNSIVEENKNYICYYAGSKRIRIVDGYIILYRLGIILITMLVLKLLLPYLQMMLIEDLT